MRGGCWSLRGRSPQVLGSTIGSVCLEGVVDLRFYGRSLTAAVL